VQLLRLLEELAFHLLLGLVYQLLQRHQA